mgnify:CR=1 FL=1
MQQPLHTVPSSSAAAVQQDRGFYNTLSIALSFTLSLSVALSLSLSLCRFARNARLANLAFLALLHLLDFFLALLHLLEHFLALLHLLDIFLALLHLLDFFLALLHLLDIFQHCWLLPDIFQHCWRLPALTANHPAGRQNVLCSERSPCAEPVFSPYLLYHFVPEYSTNRRFSSDIRHNCFCIRNKRHLFTSGPLFSLAHHGAKWHFFVCYTFSIDRRRHRLPLPTIASRQHAKNPASH